MPWQDMETQENVHEAAVYHAVLSGERLEFPPLDSIEPPCPHIKRVSLCWLRFGSGPIIALELTDLYSTLSRSFARLLAH